VNGHERNLPATGRTLHYETSTVHDTAMILRDVVVGLLNTRANKLRRNIFWNTFCCVVMCWWLLETYAAVSPIYDSFSWKWHGYSRPGKH